MGSTDNLQNIDLIDLVFKEADKLDVLRYVQETLHKNYNPDVNGYTLLFMVPPPLSGLTVSQERFGTIYGGAATVKDLMNRFARFVTFSAMDFTPPQEQLNTEKISSRTGGIPYATEYTTSEQFSVTYIEDKNLSIYNFHSLWIHYIWDIVEGKIKPHDDYLNEDYLFASSRDTGAIYGGIDYGASFYVVKYRPNLKDITYVGKCIGVFPQALPSKELIGQRTSNELTTLPFTYFCAAYRSVVIAETEENKLNDRWIYQEFKEHVESYFTGS